MGAAGVKRGDTEHETTGRGKWETQWDQMDCHEKRRLICYSLTYVTCTFKL